MKNKKTLLLIITLFVIILVAMFTCNNNKNSYIKIEETTSNGKSILQYVTNNVIYVTEDKKGVYAFNYTYSKDGAAEVHFMKSEVTYDSLKDIFTQTARELEKVTLSAKQKHTFKDGGYHSTIAVSEIFVPRTISVDPGGTCLDENGNIDKETCCIIIGGRFCCGGACETTLADMCGCPVTMPDLPPRPTKYAPIEAKSSYIDLFLKHNAIHYAAVKQ